MTSDAGPLPLDTTLSRECELPERLPRRATEPPNMPVYTVRRSSTPPTVEA